MPGGPIYWFGFSVGAAIAIVAAGGLWLAVHRFRGGDGSSLSPIAALGSGLVMLLGLFGMFISLNLWGNLGA